MATVIRNWDSERIHNPRRAPRLTGMQREPWQDFAACAEISPEIFFPDIGYGFSQARPICMTKCKVRILCLEKAMALEGKASHTDRHGMWGGLSPNERTALARKRAEEAKASQELHGL